MNCEMGKKVEMFSQVITFIIKGKLTSRLAVELTADLRASGMAVWH